MRFRGRKYPAFYALIFSGNRFGISEKILNLIKFLIFSWISLAELLKEKIVNLLKTSLVIEAGINCLELDPPISEELKYNQFG